MGFVRALSLGVFVLLFSFGTRADGPRFGDHDVRSVFYIAKSENQNQVHYAVRLGAGCRPVGAQPVFAYWRRLKNGKRVDDTLRGLGTTVYGASEHQKVRVTESGASIEMYVKALKKVRIQIRVQRDDSSCRAVAYTAIAGQWARLSHAYLQLGLLGVRVKYVDVIGYRVRDGVRVRERHD